MGRNKVSPVTISELNKKAYIYMDGIYLCRNWGREYENVAIQVVIAVNEKENALAEFYQ